MTKTTNGLLPLEDFFRNPQQAAFHISPNGKYLSYLAPFADRLNLFVRRTDGIGTPIQLTYETARSIAGSVWANDEQLLFLKDTGGDENYQLYGVDREGKSMRAFTAFEGVRTQFIDSLDHDDNHVIIAMNRDNPEVFDPYRLNVVSGELTQLAKNPGNIQGWMTDHNGHLRAATAIVDGVNTQLLYRDSEDEPLRPVLTTNFKESVSFIEFTPDNREVYAATNLGRDKTVLVRMNPATCEELELLYEHPKYDLSNISYSHKRGKLLGAFCVGHRGAVRHYFDTEEAAIRERLASQIGHSDFGTSDYDRAEQIRLIYIGGDRTYGSYHLYNVATDTLTHLADLAPWIEPEKMQAMHPVNYTTRDGLKLEAYLTLPHGLTPDTAHQLPTIINPHGGPWARDSWGFDPEVQFLASRGYAVLQMNFRGSTGYGRKFQEMAFKQWGLTMQDDITDGVHWLIDQGIADPKRIGIYGGSYGGYATLAGIAFTPELYACAVDYVGVSNLFTFMQTIPPYWKPMLEMMYEMVGHPENDKEQLHATSPVFHADRIKAPLFIAQGANDPRVNIAESDQMVNALRQQGVEVEYMVKDNEGHGFHNQENRFEFYRAMELFLAKHLNP